MGFRYSVFWGLLSLIAFVFVPVCGQRDGGTEGPRVISTGNALGLKALVAEVDVVNHPTLRVPVTNTSLTEISRQKLDGADNLVFLVFLLDKAESTGRLYVTKDRIRYAPQRGKKHVFDIERSAITSVVIKTGYKKCRDCRSVVLETSKGRKMITVASLDQNQNSVLDVARYLGATNVLLQAVNNFDATLGEIDGFISAFTTR